jgi:pimeloyl-ACP methyl ester carboxylesterase
MKLLTGPLVCCLAVSLSLACSSAGESDSSSPVNQSDVSDGDDRDATVATTDEAATVSEDPAGTEPSTSSSGGVTTTSVPRDELPRFVPGPCPVDPAPDLNVECGTVRVPEDRTRPEKGEVELAVAYVRSQSPSGAASPVVWVTGGPGGRALDVLARSAEDGGVASDPLHESHDLVYVDQRGTGSTQPSLDCPNRVEAIWEALGSAQPFTDQLDMVRESLAECRSELLSRGVDLTAYDTVSVAADFDDVREALGLEVWGVYAVSYGTLVAQEMLRSHPDAVTAVVLDSVVPIDKTDLEWKVLGQDSALDALFTECETDVDCDARYPGIRTRFADTVAAYNAQPVEITITERDGTERPVAIAGGDLQSGIISALTSTAQLPNIPLFIELAEQRSPAVVQSAVDQTFAYVDRVAEGMRDAVNCRDRYDHVAAADLISLVEARPDQTAFALHGSWAGCEVWDVGSVDESFNDLVESDTPTLIIGGRFDPQTPPAEGERIAAGLTNSTFVELDATSHAAFKSNACADQLVRQFLSNPIEPVDLTCVTNTTPIRFTM